MSHIIRSIIEKRKRGIRCGIPSFCTANPLAIEACLEQGVRFNDSILIEATANQVNQFGGYTGMRPADFRNMVYEIADKVGFPKSNIILGGDHLGPLTWYNEPEESAMQKAEDLVREYVAAGYKKIHLDTSMRLKDDSKSEPLGLDKVARRGARLYKACQEEYEKLLEKNLHEIQPVYVIGSEVPLPGGEQSCEDSMAITRVEDLHATVAAYEKAFEEFGCQNAMENVIGIVVQPGVEFGDENIAVYDRNKTTELCEAVRQYPGLVMEGHSTDYQPIFRLEEMVADGIAILKVGPALTFALREAVFALTMIENEMFPVEKQSHFQSILETAMQADDSYWKKYYQGNTREKRLKRRYSLSDRSRYYMTDERVVASMEKLFENIDSVTIPKGLLHQFLPSQYVKVREGLLECKARTLVKQHIIDTVIEEYNYATKNNYVVRQLG
ncbi:MAG: tagatose-bisphosphate aldolase [Ruminococcaceae bacterium]|nr:tagatose-bisphosphate aldolase [Oscillospiraceae bacterium]